jgi:enoyl-CoA hydratase/carnithine racemase
MTHYVEISARGSSVEIRLHRPDKKNAITGAMYSAMTAAMTAANADPAVRSILFSGVGPAFSSGNDLQDFLSAPMDENSPVLGFLAALAANTKVLIAAIQGPCVGIGATLLLHCDHVVAAESAQLHFNFIKIALVPEAASSLLLPLAVGRLKAAEILMTGDPVSSAEALRLGLVSKVVAEDSQLDSARAFADKLTPLAPEALRITRALLRADADAVAARMADENAQFKARLRSPEFKEAVAAFMQKRVPKFG